MQFGKKEVNMLLSDITPSQFDIFMFWFAWVTSIHKKELNQLRYELWELLGQHALINDKVIVFVSGFDRFTLGNFESKASDQIKSAFVFRCDGDTIWFN